MFGFLPSSGGHRAHAIVAVGDVAVRLLAASGQGRARTFQNQGSVTVFIGPSTVTASGPTAGYALFAGETFSDNASNEPWFGITASGSAPVHVIEVW